jgi:hypothetical protein
MAKTHTAVRIYNGYLIQMVVTKFIATKSLSERLAQSYISLKITKVDVISFFQTEHYIL